MCSAIDIVDALPVFPDPQNNTALSMDKCANSAPTCLLELLLTLGMAGLGPDNNVTVMIITRDNPNAGATSCMPITPILCVPICFTFLESSLRI